MLKLDLQKVLLLLKREEIRPETRNEFIWPLKRKKLKQNEMLVEE